MDTLHAVYPDKITQLLSRLAGSEGQQVRKDILTLARYQGLPTDHSSNLYGQTSTTIDLLLTEVAKLQASGILSSNTTPYEALDDCLHDRIRAGALIASMCIQPYSTEQEEDDIRTASYLKEKEVIDSRQPIPKMNYNPWSGHYGEAIHPDIPPNPDMAKVIHAAIEYTLERFTDVDITPRYSRKPLPDRTISLLKRKDRDVLDSEDGRYYQHHLEVLRGSKRICLEGGVEMRQRWYASVPNPRTYYVGGPTAFEHARFIQSFFNDLCDSLDVTNRIKRVNVKRLFLHGSKTFIFYDLSSFTSTCIAQRDFVRWLSSFARGRELRVSSFGGGTQSVDLGDVLEEYAQYVNEYMEWYQDDLDWSGTQGSGGFLGVLGNIASCTFLHGGILLMLCETQSDCGVAGDDAAALTDNPGKISKGISTIGRFQPTKVFLLRPLLSVDSDALYLKRRTFINPRTGNLTQWQYFQFPSLLLPRYRNDEQYNRRYRVELSGSKSDIRRRCISSVLSSFRSARFLSPEALSQAQSILTQYYTLLGIPHSGYVPQYDRSQSSHSLPFVPSLETLGLYDFMEETLRLLYNGWCRVPNREVELSPMYLRIKPGLVFDTRTSCHALAFLKRSGYIREEGYVGGYSTYVGEQGLSRVIDEYLNRTKARRVKRYRVVAPIPEFAWGCGGRVEIEGLPASVEDELPVRYIPAPIFLLAFVLKVTPPGGY